ncbi:hypothetical protein KAU11_07115 [Candidatus Babeliales bacterium]|nr:hypothetical protein [Candidatus Babeliales bacterium]
MMYLREILPGKASRAVLSRLLEYSDSFIVQYPEPRPNNAHRWFFVQNQGCKHSRAISGEVGEYLVEAGWIEPELSDEEYQIQIALGSIDYRVYKIAPAKQKEVEKI